MKAEIVELWESGNEIIIIDNNDCPTIADLKKCENVIIGSIKGGLIEVLLDNNIYYVSKVQFTHPSGCGKVIAWTV